MEYMGNEEFWNQRFMDRDDKPLHPEKTLVDNIEYFKQGTILDIACGDGRNALFLLKNGFKVTGIDFSNKALYRLKKFANRSNYDIHTEQIDLSKLECLNGIGMFDNVLVNHYRLSRGILKTMENHISYHGILFISGFGHRHKIDSRIRKKDLIYPTDFEDVKESFELVKYIENEDERGFFVTYIFRRLSR